MASISGEKKSIAQKAADVRPPFDGPHKPGAKKKALDAPPPSAPSYVVAVSKHEFSLDDAAASEVNRRYNPQELKAKARSFLSSPNISPQEREVLKGILEPGEDSEKKA